MKRVKIPITRFKFRVWDDALERTDNPKFHYSDDEKFGYGFNALSTFWEAVAFYPNIQNNVDIFTGILDEEKKEIYENDIISVDEMISSEFKQYRNHPIALVQYNYHLCCFYYGLPRKNLPPLTHQMLGHGNNIKVIGNIYENPDFLKI